MTGLTWRRLALIGLGILVAAGLVYGLWPKPVGVDVAAIGRGEMRVTVDEEGKTRIKEVYTVSAPITGRLRRTDLHAGDAVIAGETIVAVLDPVAPPLLDARSEAELDALIAAARAGVKLAEAELAEARSAEKLAESELARARKLARQGIVAEKVLDRAVADTSMKEAMVARAEAALAMRGRELASVEARRISAGSDGKQGESAAVVLRAPASGDILRVLAESEGVVAAGTPLVQVGDRGQIEVVVDFLSMDAIRIVPGAEAVIDGWGGAAGLPAQVERVEPMGFTKVSALGIEEQRVRTILRLTGPRESYAALGHDFRIVARVLVWRDPDALLVPLGALFRRDGGWAVFKAADGRAKLQPVELGERNQSHAVVVGGLAAEDRVILHPSDRVADGVRISIRADG